MLGEPPALEPQPAERCDDFSADCGLDIAATEALVWDEQRIPPVNDTRQHWREKQQPADGSSKSISRALYPEQADTIVYTEKGIVHCICPHTSEQRDLAFQGSKADRNMLNCIRIVASCLVLA